MPGSLIVEERGSKFNQVSNIPLRDISVDFANNFECVDWELFFLSRVVFG